MHGNTVTLALDADGASLDAAASRARALLGEGVQILVEQQALLATFPVEQSGARAADLRALARRIAETLSSSQRPGWVGIGLSTSGADAIRTRSKALAALRLGKMIWRAPKVVCYEDVRLFEVLDADRQVLRDLAALLDPLLAYDAGHGTDLVETLEAFSEADLSQVTTARRLGVHRHTVNARLHLAEKILGRSVSSGPDRILFELALKARRLLYRPADGAA